ncbi:hypothetical protein [Mycobacteroides abscessus]|uniref:hypothetical protein n=1 Tax=Mycobacteroides abscessus TaxID=36809 RepID=UPI0009278611|nr:hypothetical protein [Mycobacteroides abscessus]DAZ90295.1 TPA_asm: hypothetical protein PROPHIFSQJ01-1_9 [Mycobacterium phage prophiFSQJ01-1]SII40171.1 Uncharacterised protein [Mycobacteroides abscessus subsp. abscessus]SIK15118.1 Uncharacterised protein [Mycobacteroides abscessus subsp. abscessus]SIN24799.1 Uncharacterised protein [Mycobacteroides abscessus subsp. abscessus]SLI52135.1 Uncharacterised protein [Mycobacteroides abscessus subsp. abscessus]
MAEYPRGTMAFGVCPANDNHVRIAMKADDGWHVSSVNEGGQAMIHQEPSPEHEFIASMQDEVWIICHHPTEPMTPPTFPEMTDYPSGSVVYRPAEEYDDMPIMSGLKTPTGWLLFRVTPDGGFESMALIAAMIKQMFPGAKTPFPQDYQMFGDPEEPTTMGGKGFWRVAHIPKKTTAAASLKAMWN